MLQDNSTASSGEAVLLSFRALPNARAIGLPSAEFSSANAGYWLYDRALMLLTGAVFADLSGTEYGGPIEPDTLLPAPQDKQAVWSWLTRRRVRAEIRASPGVVASTRVLPLPLTGTTLLSSFGCLDPSRGSSRSSRSSTSQAEKRRRDRCRERAVAGFAPASSRSATKVATVRRLSSGGKARLLAPGEKTAHSVAVDLDRSRTLALRAQAQFPRCEQRREVGSGHVALLTESAVRRKRKASELRFRSSEAFR